MVKNGETSSSLSVLKTVKIAKNQEVNSPHFWSQIQENRQKSLNKFTRFSSQIREYSQKSSNKFMP